MTTSGARLCFVERATYYFHTDEQYDAGTDSFSTTLPHTLETVACYQCIYMALIVFHTFYIKKNTRP